MWLPGVVLPKALVLQDEYFGKNYLSFLDFTRYYEQTSQIFVPCLNPQSNILQTEPLCPTLFQSIGRATGLNYLALVMLNNWAVTSDFQQFDILTSVDSDEPV